MNDNERLFADNLRAILARRIRQWKREGTVSMSADNVWQCIAPEASRLACAPVGTNGAYYARQAFNAIVAQAKKRHNSFFI